MPLKVDAANARRQRRIANAIVKAGLEAVILYVNESCLQLLPLVWAMWRWVGQQLCIPTRGTYVIRALFEAFHIRTGQWIYLIRGRVRTDDFLAFLEYLVRVDSQNLILLIVDNFSSHTAHAVSA